MTLKSKFFFWVTALLMGAIILASISIWNISTAWRGAQAATIEYTAKDHADTATEQVVCLRDLLRGPDARVYRQPQHFDPLRTEIQEVVKTLNEAAKVDDGDAAAEKLLAMEAIEHFEAAANKAANGNADQAAAE